jgi:hypothetical protein
MAELHSTRRKAKSSRLRSVDRRRSVERPGLHRQRASLPGSSLMNGSTASVQLIAQLREVSRLLTVIYSTCVTAELALQGQNADHDRDILAMLRIHVSEPVSRQVEKLDTLVDELGGVAQDAYV